MIVLSTASPYKFNDSVLDALGEDTSGDPFALLDRLEKKSNTTAPKGLVSLKGAKVLHETRCEKSAMPDEVLAFAKR